MDDLFVILFLVSFAALIVGFVNPSVVRVKSRKTAVLYFGGAAFVFMILTGLTAEPVEETAPPVAREAPAEPVDAGSISAASPPAAEISSGPSLTPAQRNAVRSARSYLDFKGFSRQGLIDQLSSEYGDQYSVADATAAVASLDVDWDAQAARAATTYLEMRGFSCEGLVDQLTSEFGDQFSSSQARVGATQAGAC